MKTELDAAFLAVVAVGLGLLTVMVVVRLVAGGVSSMRVAFSVVELWAAVAIWITVFHTVGSEVVLSEGAGGTELRSLVSRIAELPRHARSWTIVGLIASIAIAAHLMLSLRRATCGTLGS